MSICIWTCHANNTSRPYILNLSLKFKNTRYYPGRLTVFKCFVHYWYKLLETLDSQLCGYIHCKSLHMLHETDNYPVSFLLPHQVMHMFKGCRREDSAPHIYSVAQTAYRNLLTTRQDQSIVLLGKSGSGKTTNCQHLVQYLVSIAGSTGKIFSGQDYCF